MIFIEGNDRTQSVLFSESLDQIISPDNEVRIIDLFVESLNIEQMGFKIKKSIEGRPAYNPKDLLKLFIYGYLNRIRSSRVLEKECSRNTELMWLLKQLVPDHNTISNFRRDNHDAIKKAFRFTVSIAKNFNLIGGALVAGDSTKLRAQNSKKNNYNPAKLEKHIQYIDSKLEEYTKSLMDADGDKKESIKESIARHTKRKIMYEGMQKELKETGDTQISTSDPDSRQMITRNNITEVAYNVQTVVDAKHCIPIDFKVTNENDSKAMGDMLCRTAEILETKNFTALYDKGYHTGSELKTAMDLGIKLMVAIPDTASNAPDVKYNVSEFKYSKVSDCYTCPEGEILTSNGNWYKKDRGKSVSMVKHYKTSACLKCKVQPFCTRNPKGRLIERSEHANYIDQNKINIEQDPLTYKKRQAIVEHPYGTIKRQWSFCHITTKRFIKRAAADVGFIFLCYNLRRILNIVDKNLLKEFLKKPGLILRQFFNFLQLIKRMLKDFNYQRSKPNLFLQPCSYRS